MQARVWQVVLNVSLSVTLITQYFLSPFAPRLYIFIRRVNCSNLQYAVIEIRPCSSLILNVTDRHCRQCTFLFINVILYLNRVIWVGWSDGYIKSQDPWPKFTVYFIACSLLLYSLRFLFHPSISHCSPSLSSPTVLHAVFLTKHPLELKETLPSAEIMEGWC